MNCRKLYILIRKYLSTIVKYIIKCFIAICGGRVNAITRLYYPNLRKHVRIKNCILTRKIIIGEHTSVNNSTLKGDISIGRNCKIYGASLTGKIGIGSFSSLWGEDIIMNSMVNDIRIGNFCSIARNVFFYEYNHQKNGVSTSFIRQNIFHDDMLDCIESKGSIVVENDVWIGAGSIVLSGVKIGNGAIIGAGSLVAHDVPDYAIVGGNPAKVIGYRFERKTRDEILASEWWLWSVNDIIKNKEYFYKMFF